MGVINFPYGGTLTTPLWARLDLRYFVTLRQVARSGSFTEAAAELGYTQSAVSQQIRRLESVIKHRVINRSVGGKSVSLTPAGRILLHHAESLTATLQRAATDIEALSSGSAGILRVGCYESVGAHLIPSVLAGYQKQFPRVQVVLTELPDDGELLERVERHDLDLTFVVFPLPDGPFQTQALLRDPYVLVTASHSPVASSVEPIDLDENTDLPLMSYGELRSAHTIETRLGRPAYRDRVVFRSNHNSTLLSLAAQGYAAAVMPWLGIDHSRDDLCVRQLAKVSPRIVGIAWHRNRPLSDAASGFIHESRVAASELEARMPKTLGFE
ncbi:LysR family transcriptional regulator [Streptomyces atratus]|uniref:LysR family transcriptional regulator n=1 Tax=Streptomyces atratus TaxID=1893 RepID=UPI0033F9099E